MLDLGWRHTHGRAVPGLLVNFMSALLEKIELNGANRQAASAETRA